MSSVSSIKNIAADYEHIEETGNYTNSQKTIQKKALIAGSIGQFIDFYNLWVNRCYFSATFFSCI